MSKFIRLVVEQGGQVNEVMLHVDHIIGVSPVDGKETQGQTWVNTAKFSYKINAPYNIVSVQIESMGEMTNA